MSTPVTEVAGKPATKKSSLAAFVVKTERTQTEAPVRKVVEGKRKNLSHAISGCGFRASHWIWTPPCRNSHCKGCPGCSPTAVCRRWNDAAPARILAVMQASRQAVGSASARRVAATPAS